MTTWLKSLDDSFDPIDDYAGAYAAGYRVWFRYVGPGSAGKHWTSAEMAKWHAQGPDTFCGFLAEGVGDEPISNPGIGDDQGASARKAMNALGVPAHVLCSPAMDRNVTKTQTLGVITTYMRNWKQGFGGLPVPYIEVENGGRLVAEGVSAGTFTPAAYSWNESGVLITPDNAPAHVVQTQERNGQNEFKGNVDLGHTKAGAPHVWWDRPGGKPPATTTGDTNDMADITPAQMDEIAARSAKAVLGSLIYSKGLGVPAPGQPVTEWFKAAKGADIKLATVLTLLGSSAKVEAAIQAAIVASGSKVDQATLAAALVDALKQLAADDTPAS